MKITQTITLACGTVRRFLENGWFLDHSRIIGHQHVSGYPYSLWEPGASDPHWLTGKRIAANRGDFKTLKEALASFDPVTESQLTREEFIAADAEHRRARERYERAQSNLGCSRWGEARRFAGRMAGNRLAEVDRARAWFLKTYDRAEKRWLKLQPKEVTP